MDDAPLGQLDFIYMPSRDVERDLAFYTGVMDAEVVFAIEAFGPRVAQVGLTRGGPRLLLAEHLEGDAPVLRLRMGDLDTTMAGLERRGLRAESRFGIPPGHARPSARLAGSGSPSTSSPAPEPTPDSPAGTTSAPGRAEATGSPGRQRRLPRV